MNAAQRSRAGPALLHFSLDRPLVCPRPICRKKAAGESMPVVELAGVTKAYENKVAVSNLSLSIDAGQMFGLLGPNGAGKTSSIRMMMGITMPDSGRISLFEKPFDRKSLERVGYLPEERGLYKKMKVIEQLVFFGQMHGLYVRKSRANGPPHGPSAWRSPTPCTRRPKSSPRACSRRSSSSPALLHEPGADRHG